MPGTPASFFVCSLVSRKSETKTCRWFSKGESLLLWLRPHCGVTCLSWYDRCCVASTIPKILWSNFSVPPRGCWGLSGATALIWGARLVLAEQLLIWFAPSAWIGDSESRERSPGKKQLSLLLADSTVMTSIFSAENLWYSGFQNTQKSQGWSFGQISHLWLELMLPSTTYMYKEKKEKTGM